MSDPLKYEEYDIVNLKVRITEAYDDANNEEQYYNAVVLDALGNEGDTFYIGGDDEIFGKEKNFDASIKKYLLKEKKERLKAVMVTVKALSKEIKIMEKK